METQDELGDLDSLWNDLNVAVNSHSELFQESLQYRIFEILNWRKPKFPTQALKSIADKEMVKAVGLMPSLKIKFFSSVSFTSSETKVGVSN